LIRIFKPKKKKGKKKKNLRKTGHNQQGGGVSHYGLAIYIKKYIKAKEEELWKLKYFFHHAKT
jgi:hypothetical protein